MDRWTEDTGQTSSPGQRFAGCYLAVVQCEAHTHGSDSVALGEVLAVAAAKQFAQLLCFISVFPHNLLVLVLYLPQRMITTAVKWPDAPPTALPSLRRAPNPTTGRHGEAQLSTELASMAN